MSLTDVFSDATSKAPSESTNCQSSSLAGDLWHSMKERVSNTADRALTGLANVSTAWGDSISRETQPGNKMNAEYKEFMKMLVGDNVVSKGFGKLADLGDEYMGQAEATVLHALGNALRPDHPGTSDKNAAVQNNDVVPRGLDQNYQQISADAGRMLNDFSVTYNSLSSHSNITREELRDLFIKDEHKI
jgi:hypothetical protein